MMTNGLLTDMFNRLFMFKETGYKQCISFDILNNIKKSFD